MQKLLLLSTLTAAALAANDTPAYQMDMISVSASPIHEHSVFDVPAQVDVLDKDYISSKATASLGAILSDIPGVNNLSTGSQAGKPVIRGMNGERVKILSNGAATDFQTYGIRHISNTDPFLTNTIEVIRGAQGVLYGSDALGGVVNILSPELLYAKEGESKIQGEVLGEYHTNNDERAGGVKMQAASGKMGVNVGVIKRKSGNLNTPDSDTWSKGEPSGTLPRFAGELPFTNFETTSAQAAIGYTDNWGNISLQHTYWQSFQNYLGHASRPNGTALTNFDYNPLASAGQELTNNETQLKGEFLSGEWIIKPSLSRTLNRRLAATNVPYESMNESNIDLDIEVERVDGKLALVHPKIGMFEGEIGIEGYDKEQRVRDGHLVPNADESGKSIYLFEEADVGQWIWQWGLRYDTRDVDADVTSNGSREFSAIGGSIGATYKLTNNWNIATNLSRGFRSPSIFELYADGIHGGVQAYQIGNANLSEETTLGGDLSLRYHDENTKATLALYRSYVNNYIYLANTGFYRNASGTLRNTALNATTPLPEMSNQQTDALIEGIEFSFDHHLSDSTKMKGAFEIIHGKDRHNDRDLTLMSANNLHLELSHNFGAYGFARNNTLSLNMKAVDDQQAAGNQEPFSQYNDKTKLPFGSADTAGYTVWGLGYNADIGIGAQKAQLGIKVTNVLNTQYRDFLDTYKGYALAMGRDVSLTLRVPFSF
jgi:iron complex outermembrane recepter protein